MTMQYPSGPSRSHIAVLRTRGAPAASDRPASDDGIYYDLPTSVA